MKRELKAGLKENGIRTWAETASAAEDRTAWRQRAYGPILHQETSFLEFFLALFKLFD